MDQNTTDTVEARVVLQGGPLDGDEYRTVKPLLPMLYFMDHNQVPVTYERAMERLYGPSGPVIYAVDDQGRHVYRPHPPLLEDALVDPQWPSSTSRARCVARTRQHGERCTASTRSSADLSPAP